MPGGTFQTNGDVPREFQQSVMEMSDDSITSLEQQAVPPDWGVSAAPVVVAPPRSNGVSSPSENG